MRAVVTFRDFGGIYQETVRCIMEGGHGYPAGHRVAVNFVPASEFSPPTTKPSTSTELYGNEPEVSATNHVVSSTCVPSSSPTIVLSSSVSYTTSSSLLSNTNVVPSSSSLSTITSPATERVEQLLDQYKACKVAQPCFQLDASTLELSTLQSKELFCELELWTVVNQELRSRGFQAVNFVQDTLETAPASAADHLTLSITSSMIARHTVSSLLRKLKQKDEDIFRLKRKLSRNAREPSTPVASCDASALLLKQCQRFSEEQSEDVTRLEYEKAKLKLDLQNKPDLHDVKVLQEKVEELEVRLLQTESNALSEEHKLNKCQLLIKRVMSQLSVSQEEHLLAGLQGILSVLDNHSKLEKHFTSLLQLIHHHSVPKLCRQKWEEPVLPRSSGHDLWCEVTWQDVVTTLRMWAHHMRGVQELECVVDEVCERLELRSTPHYSGGYLANQLGGEEEEKVLILTCQEMAVLLRRWLLTKANSKAGSHQLMCAMVRHFQHLFSVPRLKGVYPTMTLLHQQNEQYRNVITRLKDCLDLEPNCSCHKLVTVIDYIAHKDNAQFLTKVHKEWGPIEIDNLFRAVRRIARILNGVDTLSGLVPALHKLKKP